MDTSRNKSMTVSQVLTTLETTNYIDTHFYYAEPIEDSYKKLRSHSSTLDVWFAHRCLTELKSISAKLYSLTNNRKTESFLKIKEPYESCLITFAEIEVIYRKAAEEELSEMEKQELNCKLLFCCDKTTLLFNIYREASKYLYESRAVSKSEYDLISQTIEHKLQLIIHETSKRITV